MYGYLRIQLVLSAFALLTLAAALRNESNDGVETFLQNNSYIEQQSGALRWNVQAKADVALGPGACGEEETGSPLDEFPELFTEDQLRHGFVILHIFGAFYFFVLLAIVCSDYFLPTVECICEDLNMPKDVAAATFMATATSMPEFFTNMISTLITDSDMGVGTIIGSLMFNTLGVAGLAALAINRPVQLDWWPIARDCCIYIFNTIVLLVLAWGGKVSFLESCIMMVFLVIYYLVTFFNNRLMPTVRVLVEDRLNCCLSKRYDLTQPPEYSAKAKLPLEQPQFNGDGLFIISRAESELPLPITAASSFSSIEKKPDDDSLPDKLFALPRGQTKFMMCWWAFSFPIKFFLKCFIPNPLTCRRFYPLTFILCICMIGINAYMIVWMITAVGVTIGVPEIVMGLTFVAAGSGMPEAISSILALRSGENGIGVSNSLGANSLAILLSLGVPWFIKNCMHYSSGGPNSISFSNHGIGFNILILIICTLSLFVILSISGYRLTRRVGAALFSVYAVLIVFQILIETNVFYPNIC